jgi:hypothetical protein
MNTLNNDTPPMTKRTYTSRVKILRLALDAKRSTQEYLVKKLTAHLAKRKVNPRKLAKMLKDLAAQQGFDTKDVRIKVK